MAADGTSETGTPAGRSWSALGVKIVDTFEDYESAAQHFLVIAEAVLERGYVWGPLLSANDSLALKTELGMHRISLTQTGSTTRVILYETDIPSPDTAHDLYGLDALGALSVIERIGNPSYAIARRRFNEVLFGLRAEGCETYLRGPDTALVYASHLHGHFNITPKDASGSEYALRWEELGTPRHLEDGAPNVARVVVFIEKSVERILSLLGGIRKRDAAESDGSRAKRGKEPR